MINTLILSHGSLARELLAAAKRIAVHPEGLSCLCLDWDDGVDEARTKLEAALDGLDGQDGVLILTDMFGDTPTNAARHFHDPGRVEIVTGVNLPMVVRIGCLSPDSRSVGELAEWVTGKGRGSICRVETAQSPINGTNR